MLFPARFHTLLLDPRNVRARKAVEYASKGANASDPVLLNRELAFFMRWVQQQRADAKTILEHYQAKENSKAPDFPADLRKIEAAFNRVEEWWGDVSAKYEKTLDMLPDEAVRGIEKYLYDPEFKPFGIRDGAAKPGEYFYWLKSIYEWLYMTIRQVNNLKEQRPTARLPKWLMNLKPSDRYAGSRDVLEDFGTLLQEVMRGRIMVEKEEPNPSRESLDTYQPINTPKLRGRQGEDGLTAAQIFFIRHHVGRIEGIQNDWQHLKNGVFEIVKKDQSDATLLADELNERKGQVGGSEQMPPEINTYVGQFIDGYRDLISTVVPLTRSLDTKYMMTVPPVEGRTFKQARQALYVWYKASAERLTRLYQFLGKYMGLKSRMGKAMKMLAFPAMKGYQGKWNDGEVWVENPAGYVHPYDVGGRVGDFVSYRVNDIDYRGVVVRYRNGQLTMEPRLGVPKPRPKTITDDARMFSVVTPREGLPGYWQSKPPILPNNSQQPRPKDESRDEQRLEQTPGKLQRSELLGKLNELMASLVKLNRSYRQNKRDTQLESLITDQLAVFDRLMSGEINIPVFLEHNVREVHKNLGSMAWELDMDITDTMPTEKRKVMATLNYLGKAITLLQSTIQQYKGIRSW